MGDVVERWVRIVKASKHVLEKKTNVADCNLNNNCKIYTSELVFTVVVRDGPN